jgi:hypothetical protein
MTDVSTTTPTTATAPTIAASYIIVGNAACPFYALAERLGQILQKSALAGIETQAVHPDQWSGVLHTTISQLGFRHMTSPLVYTKAGRYIGDSNAFAIEVNQKYGIVSDISSLHRLQGIANENMNLLLSKRAADLPKIYSFRTVFGSFPPEAAKLLGQEQLRVIWNKYDSGEEWRLPVDTLLPIIADVLSFTRDIVLPQLRLVMDMFGVAAADSDGKTVAMSSALNFADVAQLGAELRGKLTLTEDGCVELDDFIACFYKCLTTALSGSAISSAGGQ